MMEKLSRIIIPFVKLSALMLLNFCMIHPVESVIHQWGFVGMIEHMRGNCLPFMIGMSAFLSLLEIGLCCRVFDIDG